MLLRQRVVLTVTYLKLVLVIRAEVSGSKKS